MLDDRTIHECGGGLGGMGFRAEGEPEYQTIPTAEGIVIGVRVGVCIFGSGTQEGPESPWHPEFIGNYCEAYGKTAEDALENLRKKMKREAEALW